MTMAPDVLHPFAAAEDGAPALASLPDLGQADPDPEMAPPAGPETCRRTPGCPHPNGHRGRCKSPPKAPAASRSTTSSRPTPSGRSRTPKKKDEPLWPALIGMAYGYLGAGVEMLAPAPAGAPVGRVMQFQAPLAGKQIHEALSHVPVYKRVTALSGGDSPFGELAALLAGPIIAGVMATNPAAAEMLVPLFMASLQSSAVEMAKQQRASRDALAEVNEYAAEIEVLMGHLVANLFDPPAGEDDDGHLPGA